MRIIAIGDVHNDIENLIQFLDGARELKPDVLVFSGDFIDIGMGTRGFGRVDLTNIILEELESLGVPVLAVPGNHDSDALGVLNSRGVSLHGEGKIVNGVGFYGFGGAKTPFGTPLEPGEEELYAGLKKSYEMVKDAKIKVQVTHNPPYNTRLDIIGSGAHVGSAVVRKFIEDFKPNVAVCAHIHEARGVDNIGETKIVNPGRFPEGYCGLIDIDTKTGNATAKIVNLI